MPLRISLGPDVLVAWLHNAAPAARGEALRIPLAVWDGTERWPALVDALGTMLRRAGLAGGGTALCVSILPPLAQLRAVEARVRDAGNVRRLLTRDATTYFFAARQPHVVAVDRAERTAGEGHRFVAAAIPAALFDAVTDACQANGLERLVLLPAHEAWLGKPPHGDRVIEHAGVRYTLTAAGGHITSVRRIPVPNAERDAAEALAAEGALPAPRLQFIREEAYAQAAAGVRHVMRVALGAAAAALLLMAALQLLDVRRELGAITQARAALAPQLANALRERDGLFALERDIAAIRRRESTAASWTRAFETIARALPPSATLLTLRGEADTLIIEGTAPNAGAVFEAVQRAAGVASVRSVAPVRQAFDSVRGPFELFSLALTLNAKSMENEQ